VEADLVSETTLEGRIAGDQLGDNLFRSPRTGMPPRSIRREGLILPQLKAILGAILRITRGAPP
jgi:hypothetical protein